MGSFAAKCRWCAGVSARRRANCHLCADIRSESCVPVHPSFDASIQCPALSLPFVLFLCGRANLHLRNLRAHICSESFVVVHPSFGASSYCPALSLPFALLLAVCLSVHLALCLSFAH